MAKALQNFELSALHFDSRLLLLGGILVGIAGLCIWLGGLRWAGQVAAVIGGLIGLICAYAFTDRAAPALVIAPVVAAGLAAFAKKPAIVLSARAARLW